MSYTVKIPVSDHDTACTDHYLVDYKRQGEGEYQPLYPYPTDGEVIIENLNTGVYNVRVSRVCCTGEISPISNINVNIP